MKNITFEQLEQELENKGIVFESGECDEYETCCYLEGIYEWGFTTITSCNVIDPIITFYDWKYQSICCVDLDDYSSHRVIHGVLSAETKYLFCEGISKFCYDLRHGAPVHLDDIVSIGYDPSEKYHDKRFYELKDGRIYYKEDGALLMTIDQTAKDALMQSGFVLIESEHYPNNVNVLNDMIVKK